MDLDIIYIYIFFNTPAVDGSTCFSVTHQQDVTFPVRNVPIYAQTRCAIGGMCRYRALRGLHYAPMWSFFFPSSSKMSRVESEDVEGEVVMVVVGGVGVSGGAGN